MVKQLISFFLFLFSPLLFSSEFIATVNRNQVNVGEGFSLNLTLKDVTAKSAPSLDQLKSSFIINSQQQSSNTMIMNGQVTASTSWKLTLISQREGEVEIPSININTSEGVLSTQPIKIQVVKGASTSESLTSGISISTAVSHLMPYKNEPIFFTVKITSKHNLANIQMQKIDIQEAIIEQKGEPKIYENVIEGIRVVVIEFNYLITPLKAGVLKIPSSSFQGDIPVKRKSSGSFFDNDFDPFSLMQGYSQLKPFVLSTEEVILTVLPAVASVNPWLPAKSLNIEEIWNESQPLQVGEPFTREFKIVAEGLESSQLPNLNDLQIRNHLFKIYADKPEFGDVIKSESIKSYRKELYTIIPQQAGDLLLPEISIAWWDVTKNEKVVSRVPSRTLNILPAIENLSENNVALVALAEVPTEPKPELQNESESKFLWYILNAGSIFILFIIVIWGFFFKKQKTKVNPSILPKVVIQKEKKSEKLTDLNPT